MVFWYTKKYIKNILLVFLGFKKLALVYDLSKLLELYKLHELYKIYELYKLYELCKLYVIGVM